MNHSLQTASFSSSSDEQDTLLVPTTEMISQYNRQYSMVVKQIQRFLKEATESVQRFVAFHNFGVNFNLPHLLSNLVNASGSFKNHMSQREGQHLKDPKVTAKNKYQISFNRLMQRMSDLFKDMIDCELQFKQQYFGIKNQQEQSNSKTKIRRTLSPINYSVSSMTKSSKSQKLKLQDLIENQVKEEVREAELRATLNQRLKPKTSALHNECKLEYSTTENLYRLNEKIDQMVSDMQMMHNREEKLIELFNLNRVKKIHATAQELPLPSCLNTSSLSVIPSGCDEGEEEMDSILQSWRQVRKGSDSYAEQGFQENNFFKKRRGE